MKGEYNPHRSIKYSPPSPWISLMLYALLANTFVLFMGSYASLTGSTKIYPRLFFGIFVAAIPFFLVSGITILMWSKKLYPRVLWDLVLVVFIGYMAWGLTTGLALKHILTHGNESGTMPFEVLGDLGSTFIVAHSAVFFSSIFVVLVCARAILGYSLDAYPLSVLKGD